MTEWIKCSERMPEVMKDVLLFDRGNMTVGWLEMGERKFYFTWGGRCSMSGISHWMPLPEPPEEE